ncbi:MAG TPA: hypothetical protein PLH80_01685 [Spirochaetota bacterium]|nr:hypothetical protein [Spirochaetota bacterium]HOM87070.1 hypothetical protein [Spirochaetota bacterium]HOT20133.1 hypothetical protein [Spirochaetota bacterium]HPD05225.1 hypothetical protein [Spirochaetota bacterium]HQG41353.1 hypothetical protein [Spirochaetota bacterium]
MNTGMAHNIFSIIIPMLKAGTVAVTIALIMLFISKKLILVRQIICIKRYAAKYQLAMGSITSRFAVNLPVVAESLQIPDEIIDEAVQNSKPSSDSWLYMPHQGHVYRIHIARDIEEIELENIGALQVHHIGDSRCKGEYAVLTQNGVTIYQCADDHLVLKKHYPHDNIQQFYADSEIVITAAYKTIIIHNRKDTTTLRYSVDEGVCTYVSAKSLVVDSVNDNKKYAVIYFGNTIYFLDLSARYIQFEPIRYITTNVPITGEYEKGFIMNEGFTYGNVFIDIGTYPQKLQYAVFGGRNCVFFIAHEILYCIEVIGQDTLTGLGINIVSHQVDDFCVADNVLVAHQIDNGFIRYFNYEEAEVA